jgi:hypothetical protein
MQRRQDMQFDVSAMTEYVKEILGHCNMTVSHAQKFVEVSLERKKRFHNMGFDDFGRREITFGMTPEILLRDCGWFRVMLEELGFTTDHLTVMMGKVFVLTKRGGGSPLTKELSKISEKLFSNRLTWYNSYPYKDEVFGRPDVFLARLGEIVLLDKKAIISINPGDILRKSIDGKYAGYHSCHNLKNGLYRQGCVNYALDNSHIISYVCGTKDPMQKMLARTMMVISEDLNVVAMRKFYMSPEAFGESRAKLIREEVQRTIDPTGSWTKSKTTELLRLKEAGNGYLDPISIATYKDPTKKTADYEMSRDVFCFACGKLHTNPGLYCSPKCGR